MDDSKFDEALTWGREQGLKLNPAVERKCVDGVYGMYASTDLPKYTVLGQYPVSNLLPLLKDFKYPEGTSFMTKYIHTTAKELGKGKLSLSWGFMKGFYDEDFFKKHNAYYFSDDEVNFLKTVNNTLYSYVQKYKNNTHDTINAFCDMDKDLDRNLLTSALFNYRYRAWGGGNGFIPVLDMFNHSDLFGSIIVRHNDHVMLVTSVDYKKGNQIWISYGKRDIYKHAIDYGYFDPSGEHCIDLGLRIAQTARDDLQRKIFHYTKNKYKNKLRYHEEKDGSIDYKLQDGHAYLLEHAPNTRAIDFIRDVSFGTKKEFSSRLYHPSRFRVRLLQYIDVLVDINKVDDFTLEEFPEKMKYFYHMLKREKAMLHSNREWVMTDSDEDDHYHPDLLKFF